MAWKVIDNLRQQQSLSISYFDLFWLFSIRSLVLIPLVLLLCRPVAEDAAALHAE